MKFMRCGICRVEWVVHDESPRNRSMPPEGVHEPFGLESAPGLSPEASRRIHEMSESHAVELRMAR